MCPLGQNLSNEDLAQRLYLREVFYFPTSTSVPLFTDSKVLEIFSGYTRYLVMFIIIFVYSYTSSY